MKNVIEILILFGIFFVLGSRESHGDYNQGMLIVLTGFLLLSGYLFAEIIKKIKLPKLTGYMLIGILLGPIGLNFLNPEVVERLSFLENLALSLIAITAGGEFKFKKFKKYKKSITLILIFQIVTIFLGTGLLFLMAARYFNYISQLDFSLLIGFAILLAGAAISTSPAVTIGIITELKSRGKITDIVLMVTVLKAIILVFLFPGIIISAKYFLIEGTTFNLESFIDIIIQLGRSIFSGFVLGVVTIWYLKKIKVEKSIFLFGLTVVVTEISALLGMEILLTSIVIGIIVQNFSAEGNSLISGIELFSLPLYVLFFCFAGAGLHLDIIFDILPITLFLVISRFCLIFMGNYAGALIANEDSNVKKYSWLGYTGQAGIALGLGIIIEKTFPGATGQIFLTIIIATVVINELIGPISFKFVLSKVNESNEESIVRKKNYTRL